MNIYTEVTPNPATLKFVTDKILLASGAADFPTADSVGERSALATKLFKYPFVKGIMIAQNFVTVTKSEEAKWEDLIPVIKNEVRTSIQNGEVIVDGEDLQKDLAEASEIEQKIKQLIDEQVRPAVAMDGGDIVYEGFDDGIVKLQLRGSCSGCPSSIVTLKAGIQSLLQRMVPEVKEVVAV
jgi:Fe-S cluster biogenesis protein NfuA